MNTKDIPTQELLHGMLLLLEAYPNSKVRVGYDQDICIEKVDNKLPEEDKKLLESYNWEFVDYNDSSFWEYSMKHKK